MHIFISVLRGKSRRVAKRGNKTCKGHDCWITYQLMILMYFNFLLYTRKGKNSKITAVIICFFEVHFLLYTILYPTKRESIK